MSNNSNEEWLLMCKRIENALTDLRADQVIFNGFMEIVESNPKLPDNNLFIVWAWRNYLFTAAIAIRRQLSTDSRDVSLVNLLESAYSEGFRPGIPTESGHDSERSRPPFRRESSRF